MRALFARRTTLLIASTVLVGAMLQLLGGSADRLDSVRGVPASQATRHRDSPRPQHRTRIRTRQLTPAAASALFAAAKRTADASRAGSLFAPKSWYTPPPPPPPSPPAPQAAPTAPPLPYTLMGSYTNADNETVYFLSRDDRVYDIKAGDTLDQVYDVSVEGEQLIFTYKPLNVRQTMPLGGGS